MLAKQLEYPAGASSAGIVLGARVPIALTSRADPPRSRVASASLALLVAHNARRSHPKLGARLARADMAILAVNAGSSTLKFAHLAGRQVPARY